MLLFYDHILMTNVFSHTRIVAFYFLINFINFHRCRPPWTDPRKMFGSPTSNEVDKTNTGTGVTGSNPNNSPSTTANGVTANGQTIDTLDGNNGNAVSPGTYRENLTLHDALVAADAKRTPSYSSDLHFLGIIM